TGRMAADVALAFELTDERLHRVGDLLVRSVVAPPKVVCDLVAAGVGDDALPNRGADSAQAVVRARREVDENDLALDRLVDHIRAVNPMPHFHSSLPFGSPRQSPRSSREVCPVPGFLSSPTSPPAAGQADDLFHEGR